VGLGREFVIRMNKADFLGKWLIWCGLLDGFGCWRGFLRRLFCSAGWLVSAGDSGLWLWNRRFSGVAVVCFGFFLAGVFSMAEI
jgi:hypothetical protein